MTYPVVYTPEPTKPSGGTRPGTKVLYEFVNGRFDVADHVDDITGLGTYNPRDVAGNAWPGWTKVGSQHASGRAGDSGVPVVRPSGHPEGHRLADWLVANHEALGVQEVIFAGRRWTNRGKQWNPYNGRSDHFDHVHWALNEPASEGLTLEQILAVWTQEEDMTPDQAAKLDQVHYALTQSVQPTLSWLVTQAGDHVDEAQVADLVLAGLKPDAIAAAVVKALPKDQAAKVADELAKRLKD